jgi:hypothetical protein
MIMRFRPANIRLINRRSKLLRLLLALSSGKDKSSDNDKNIPTDLAVFDTVTPYQADALIEAQTTLRAFAFVYQVVKYP